ncbi:hypothetical protein [uncultured Helicobacter sp.]|uniref:hypothetical protein n=1 Tax=uncultured Helicobacter sp. TaxID=175537 RepID=UPI00374F4087
MAAEVVAVIIITMAEVAVVVVAEAVAADTNLHSLPLASCVNTPLIASDTDLLSILSTPDFLHKNLQNR